MSSSKRKILISALTAGFMIIIAMAILTVAFSLTQQTITTTGLKVEYIVEDVNGTVYATYKIGSGEEKYLIPNAIDAEHINGNSLIFKATDSVSAGSLEFPVSDQHIELNGDESIIMKYTYSNTGDKHYIATLSFDSALTFENMKITYSTNGTDFAEDRYALVVPSETTSMSYWIKISVANTLRDASLNGDFNWVLEGCNKSSQEYESLTALEFTGSDGAYSASLSGAGGQEGKIIFPSAINGDPVTTIVAGNMSKEEKAKVKEIILSDSVTTIGKGAFSYYHNVTDMELPDAVQNLEDQSFYGCTGLKRIKFGKSVQNLGANPFGYTPALESIEVDIDNTTYYSENNCLIRRGENGEKILELGCKTSVIPNDVTELKRSSFFYCLGLTSINIPASVIKMNGNPFSACRNVTNITVAEGNPVFCVTTDANASQLLVDYIDHTLIFGVGANIIVPADIEEIGGNAFVYFYNKLNSISFAESSNLKRIGQYAFQSCEYLTEINLPDSLEEIGTLAFTSCKRLESVTIPKNVNTINVNPFWKCTNLTSITVSADNTAYKTDAEGKNLIETNTSGLISTIATTIPNNVAALSGYCFIDGADITEITIPANVVTIYNNAFYGFDSLERVTFEITTGWYYSKDEIENSGNIDSTKLSNQTQACSIIKAYMGSCLKR